MGKNHMFSRRMMFHDFADAFEVGELAMRRGGRSGHHGHGRGHGQGHGPDEWSRGRGGFGRGGGGGRIFGPGDLRLMLLALLAVVPLTLDDPALLEAARTICRRVSAR